VARFLSGCNSEHMLVDEVAKLGRKSEKAAEVLLVDCAPGGRVVSPHDSKSGCVGSRRGMKIKAAHYLGSYGARVQLRVFGGIVSVLKLSRVLVLLNLGLHRRLKCKVEVEAVTRHNGLSTMYSPCVAENLHMPQYRLDN